MDAVFYWEMTYGEIVAAIKGYQKRKQAELQAQAIIAYRQAEITSSLVSKVLGGKHKAPTIYEAFPGFFPEEQRPRQQNWLLMKARVEAYAAEKRKRGEQNGNDARRATDLNYSGNSGA